MHVKFWGVRGSIPRPADSDELAARLVEALYRLGQQSNYLDLSDRSAIKKLGRAIAAFDQRSDRRQHALRRSARGRRTVHH